jgi:signal transduction histidine kinase
MTDFDICETAGQALLSFEQRINRKELNVDIQMPDLGLRVHGANDLITQVLYNLIDNAVKFVDREGTLRILISQQGSRAVVTVGNTGPVIPPEELPLVFDRFHKTDKSRSTDRDGAGLGLYIVKTIIHAHGQDVYVSSREGNTEFTFTLQAL